MKKYATMTFAGAYIVEAKSKSEAVKKLKEINPFLAINNKNVYKYN
jgi:hypothetical protein